MILIYTVVAGFLMEVPRLPILNESIRSLYFHVPMWFTMVLLLMGSLFFSVKYLMKKQEYFDILSREFTTTALFFGILGLITGMVWGTFTWGEPWSSDPKQNSSAICLLMYLGLFLLRNSIADDVQRARIASVYTIFAFTLMVVLLFVYPRMKDSLHPGAGGNPGFNAYDLDNRLRWVFYPAVIGWTMLGIWISLLKVRMAKILLPDE